MFQSSKYFKQVPCPFFKHDLCHRPYCHFRHAKSRKDKEKNNGGNVDSILEGSKENKVRPRSPEIEEVSKDVMNIVMNSRPRTPPIEEVSKDVMNIVMNSRPRTPPIDEVNDEIMNIVMNSRTRSPPAIEEVNDDFMNIVKKISPSKLIEYAKRKQEVQELQQALAQVDKETRDIIDNPTAPIVILEDESRGLIDTFYSKEKVPVNITSGDVSDSAKDTTKTSVNDIPEGLSSNKDRKICYCDDPDCSGFIEEAGENNIVGPTPMNFNDEEMNIDPNTIEDDYMRRKLQKRLERKKKLLSQTETFSSEFPKTGNDVRTLNMAHAGKAVDEDVNSYIDQCKEEYKRKKEEERLSKEKDILENITNIPLNNKSIPEITNNECSMVNGENVSLKSQELPIEEKNDNIKKVREKKINMLTDIDFFGNKIPNDHFDFPEIDDNESYMANEQNLINNSPTKEKQCDEDNGEKNKKKKKNDSTTEEKCSNGHIGIKKIKKKRSNSISTLEKSDGDNVNKKIKNRSLSAEEKQVNDGDGVNKKTKKSSLSNVNGDNSDRIKEKKRKKVRISLDENHVDKDVNVNNDSDKINGVSKKKKVKLSKENGDTVRMEEECFEPRQLKNNDLKKSQLSNNLNLKNGKASSKITENNIQKKNKKDFLNENNSLKKRKHADSESSDASRNAFDVIAISSSDDDRGFGDDTFGIDSEDECYDDGTSMLVNVSGDSSFMHNSSFVHGNHNSNGTVNSPGEPKKRIGLSNEQIPRKSIQPSKPKTQKISYVSPGIAGTASVNKVINKSKPANTTPVVNNVHHVNTTKKRIAHVNPNQPPPNKEKEIEKEKVKSKTHYPKLEIDIGGKVPHLIRQKYLEKMIDEIIPKVSTEEEAFEKSLADEADVYNRSNRKQIYMNLCANIIKRIRSMPNYREQPKVIASPMKTAEPTVKSIPKRVTQSKPNHVAPIKKVAVKEQPKKVVTPVKTTEATGSFVSRIKASTISGYKKIEVKDNVPKQCIKPASSEIVNKVKPVVKPRERKTSITLEPLELTENNFYEHMQQYLLTEDQLWDNKYPRRDPDNPEATQIKEYVPSANVLKRVCCRCGKEYFMNKKGKYVTRDECHFHWGKQLKQRGRNSSGMVYTCCQAGVDGLTCAMCRLHVSNKNGPLDNYVSTENCDNMDSKRKVFALDCEMCYTTHGLELTRLTVIDFDLEQIIDLFVKPSNPIVDYNTRFSGVTKQHLQDVDTTIKNIQDILLGMFDKNTILLGHSLESDLNALNIIHHKVVDTSIVFPHRVGLPLKRALRNLTVEYLQKVIQSGEYGHDSCEDARACMELMRYKFKEDQKKRKRPASTSSTGRI